MRFSFVHTADWQIGKPFGRFEPDKAAVLRHARIDVIDRVVEAAVANGARHILVAGDVFDSETASIDKVVAPLVARLAGYREMTWHLLPGNHDPARPGGVWDSVRALQPPETIVLHLAPVPREIEPGVFLLPAPLVAKSASSDPTAWMDTAATPPGALRIGLAHGSIKGFDSLGEAAVPIDPSRVRTAGLTYLALGDWHGVKQIGPRAWYSGTPECDAFADNEPGSVLLIAAGTGEPAVATRRTGRFRWIRRTIDLTALEDIAATLGEIELLGPEAGHVLYDIRLRGRLGVHDADVLDRQMRSASAGLFAFNVDRGQLDVVTGGASLETGDATLDLIARRLEARAQEGDPAHRRAAKLALVKLAAMSRTPAEGAP